MDSFVCDQCGKGFARARSYTRRHRFCSRQCSLAWGRLNRPHPNAAKDRCVHGHLYTPENTGTAPDRRRRCLTCLSERQRKYVESHSDRVSAARHRRWERERVRVLPESRARNDRSRESARRHGLMWTGPELEVASREDLSAAQVAAMLGRTLRAVQTMRERMRKEPTLQQLASV